MQYPVHTPAVRTAQKVRITGTARQTGGNRHLANTVGCVSCKMGQVTVLELQPPRRGRVRHFEDYGTPRFQAGLQLVQKLQSVFRDEVLEYIEHKNPVVWFFVSGFIQKCPDIACFKDTAYGTGNDVRQRGIKVDGFEFTNTLVMQIVQELPGATPDLKASHVRLQPGWPPDFGIKRRNVLL